MEIGAKDKKITPLFKWPGGKRWFAKKYSSPLNNILFDRIVEPFGGGMALSLHLSPKLALIGDNNPHLINFYQHLKKAAFTLDPSFCSKEQYYHLREHFNKLILEKKIHTLEAAQIFWQLNRWGYNGLCRFNQKGLLNVPYGDNKSAKSFDLEQYHEIIKGWDFISADFESLDIKGNDLIFCDPPYDKAFQGYTKGGFSFDNQERLVRWLDKHTGPIILMNHPTDKIMELYQDFGYNLTLVNAPRTINCQSDKRQPCQEVVAIRNFSWKIDGKKIQ